MPHRSPARFLAPLALLAAVGTIFLVARPELRDSPSPGRSSSGAEPAAQSTGTTRQATSPAPKAKAKTYTVKPGDVLGSISESTGVAQADLLDFNDIDDPQSLRVGQKLKLAP